MNKIKQLYTTNFSIGINTKEFLIIHHTGNTHLQGNINVLSGNTNIKVSAHYLVDYDGNIYKWNTEDYIMWHCGLSSYGLKFGLNKYSIGIETIGPGFTDKQRKSVDKLILDVCKRNNILKEKVLRHKDISIGRKIDIDDSFWNNNFSSWDNYINYLFSKNKIMSFYKEIFERENPNGSSVFNDLEGAVEKCIDEKGDIIGDEFFYLTMIGLERIKKTIKV